MCVCVCACFFRLVSNCEKSVRYATHPRDVEALEVEDGPPVRGSFRDLGVAQRVSLRRGPVTPADRMVAAYGRLDRCAKLLLPFAVKLLIVAASAVSAMMFGAGQALVPAVDIASARRKVYAVLNKGRYGASADALSVLLNLPWRVDPEAYSVVAPWNFLLGAVADGHVSVSELRDVLRRPRAGGPAAAAAAGLRRAGVEVQSAGWVGHHGRRLEAPLEQPRAIVVDFLVNSWRSRRWALLVRLRGHFATVHRPDPAGMAASLRAARPRDQQGALIAALSGAVVTQSVACKWRGGDATCLHCRLAAETPYHRFWECPQWSTLRARLGVFVAPPGPLASTGVLPMDPDLWARLGRAEAAKLDAPAPHAFRSVWLDGSAFETEDPVLCRAGWAVVWWDSACRRWGGASGPVPGAQTVPRAELSALVWASEAAPGPLRAASDCRYVVHGALRLTAGDGAPLLEGRHGDLWRQVVATLRKPQTGVQGRGCKPKLAQNGLNLQNGPFWENAAFVGKLPFFSGKCPNSPGNAQNGPKSRETSPYMTNFALWEIFRFFGKCPKWAKTGVHFFGKCPFWAKKMGLHPLPCTPICVRPNLRGDRDLWRAFARYAVFRVPLVV